MMTNQQQQRIQSARHTRESYQRQLRKDPVAYRKHQADLARSKHNMARTLIHNTLGGRCGTCGTHDNLQMHHIHYDGHTCRQAHGNGTAHLYYHIRTGQAAIRADLALLCRRCHTNVHMMISKR